MMDFADYLLDNWIEYSGGSRPNSNMLCFERDGDEGIKLHIRYVFDWETKEVENLTFKLTTEEFFALVDALLAEGSAELVRNDEKQTIHFEWHRSEGRVRFRIRGNSQNGLHGATQYNMLKFADLLLDDVVLDSF